MKNKGRACSKRRASTLVYVSVMMVAITSVVVSTVHVNVAAASKADRRIQEAKDLETFNAQEALIASLCKSNAIALPYDFHLDLNGRRMYCTVSDNNANISRTYFLAADLTGAKSQAYTRVIGGRQTTHPFYYALWAEDNVNTTGKSLITMNGGPVYAHGDLTLAAGSIVSGDVMATGTTTTTGSMVAKNVMRGLTPGTISTVPKNTLQGEATTLDSILTNLVGVNFLSLLLNGHYALHYYTSANTVRGSISGKGTAVFDGNVTVNGNVSYANGSSRCVFIVNGNLTIDPTVTFMDGHWYVTGNVTAGGTAATLQMGRGALAFGGTNQIARPMNIGFDNAFFVDRSEAVKHCVPGFWPTPANGLMR